MQDHTAESIKSLEGFKRAWIEEAQTLSQRSLTLLRPTLRERRAPRSGQLEPAAQDGRHRRVPAGQEADNAIVVEANWRDNPWFPHRAGGGAQAGPRLYPDRYDHIWEGGYAKALEGAYFAKQLAAGQG
jgi:phage terminase large subunit